MPADMSLTFNCPTREDTCKLGQQLAQAIITHGNPGLILLQAPLGGGKTTFTSALVNTLPGGDQAEVSSPSFTICNHYPTSPPIMHCDLYRCEKHFPDEAADGLESSGTLCLIEWAEYLPSAFLPRDYLDIHIQTCDTVRLFALYAHGDIPRILLEALR